APARNSGFPRARGACRRDRREGTTPPSRGWTAKTTCVVPRRLNLLRLWWAPIPVTLEIVRPRIYSYQGASWSLPPNTIEAFEEALVQGAEGLVVDVSLTRDGIPIAGNDRLVRALALGPRRVDQLDWSTLQQADLAQVFGGPRPLHIPRLADVLTTFARRTSVVLRVFKRPTAVHVVDALARLAVPLDGIALMSGSLRTLERIELPVRRYLAAPSTRLRSTEHIDGLAWPSLALPSLALPLRSARRLRILGLDCDSSASASTALDFGCDIVLTERPAWLRQRFTTLARRAFELREHHSRSA